MQLNNLTNTDMIIYHNHQPIQTCKADHIGFMGVYLKNINLGYPVGTSLEIEFIIHHDDYMESKSVLMVVNKSGNDGTGLRLTSFQDYDVNKWQDILQDISHAYTQH
jgi:hypothetical protein